VVLTWVSDGTEGPASLSTRFSPKEGASGIFWIERWEDCTGGLDIAYRGNFRAAAGNRITIRPSPSS